MSAVAVIACSVMQLELEAVINGRDIDLILVEQGLHNTPQLMPARIQEKVDEAAAKGAERVLLGYGLCSNGVRGVGGQKCPLSIPRCHDCISLLLGSVKRYNELFSRRPGTIYLSWGWLNECDDPLGALEKKYIPRMGEKKAMRAMQLELMNYTHVCLINNGVGDLAKVRERALENCRVFKKEFMEVEGSLDYFRALVDGPRPEDAFVSLSPGETLNDDQFYKAGR